VPMAVSLPENSEATYYTRWSHSTGGPYPLKVTKTDDGTERYELERGRVKETFGTWSGLVTAVHGASYLNRHWSKDRYLARGRFARQGAMGEPGMIIVGPLEDRQLETILVGPSLEVQPDPSPPTMGSQITIHVPEPHGIDLQRRGHEVAKLLFAGFSSWMRTSGYDPDDVLQDVYRKILVANQGTRPWDPEKSSFGHYVHMICRSALSNYHRKQSRVRAKEQLGLPGVGPDGTWSIVDVASQNNRKYSPDPVLEDPARDLQRYITGGPYRDHPQAELASRLLPYIQAGHTLKKSAELLKVERTAASKAMKLLKLCAAGWAS